MDSIYHELFELMSREHGVTLLDTELQEIIQVAMKIGKTTEHSESPREATVYVNTEYHTTIVIILLSLIDSAIGKKKQYAIESFKYFFTYFDDIHSGSISCGCTKQSCEGCSVMDDLNNPGGVPTTEEIISNLPSEYREKARKYLST